MNLFETVKTAVNAREAAQLYGVAVNRCGMALCPFHNDHHPSLLVADDHYHCFACGAHGDVIDLAANLFGLSLYDAARKLAADFHLAPDTGRVETAVCSTDTGGNAERAVCGGLPPASLGGVPVGRPAARRFP